jgi:hypothetical protein
VGLKLGTEMSRRAVAPSRQMMKRRSRGGNSETLPVPDLEHEVAPLVPDSEQEGASPIPTFSHSPPSQSRADALAAGQSPCPSGDLRDQHHVKLSREQSLARVADENQQEKVISFRAWTEETAHWGGRVLDAPAAQARTASPNLNTAQGPVQTERTLQTWMEISEASPFSAHSRQPLPQRILHCCRRLDL